MKEFYITDKVENFIQDIDGKTCAEVGLPREVTLTLSYGVSRI